MAVIGALVLTHGTAGAQEFIPLSRYSEIRFDSVGLGFDGHPNLLVTQTDSAATFDEAYRGETWYVEPGGATNNAIWDVSQLSTIVSDRITAQLQQQATTATDHGSPLLIQDTRFVLDFVVPFATVAVLDGAIATEPCCSSSWARVMLLQGAVALFNSEWSAFPYVIELQPLTTYELAVDVYGRAFLDATILTSAEATLRVVEDTDGDGILDNEDNCTLVVNADQRDTNGDGYGNVCDPDLDDNELVNRADIRRLKAALFTADADADLNGDGIVSLVDLGIAKQFLFEAPGPSGMLP